MSIIPLFWTAHYKMLHTTYIVNEAAKLILVHGIITPVRQDNQLRLINSELQMYLLNQQQEDVNVDKVYKISPRVCSFRFDKVCMPIFFMHCIFNFVQVILVSIVYSSNYLNSNICENVGIIIYEFQYYHHESLQSENISILPPMYFLWLMNLFWIIYFFFFLNLIGFNFRNRVYIFSTFYLQKWPR